jgi:phosphohistidine phosphatase
MTPRISDEGRLNMKLYLVQHAKASPKEEDPDRPLTEEGKQDMERIARFIKPLKLEVDCLWHSGKKRAAQTAGLLAGAIKVREGITAHNGLGPNDDVAGLVAELGAAEKDVMIVGHLPFLSKLASLLLAGSESTNTVGFRNGGIACLEWAENKQWQIEWVVTPELLV